MSHLNECAMESGIDLDEYNATSSHQNIMYKGHTIETCYNECSSWMYPWSAFTRGIGTINEESREDAIRVMKSKIKGLS
jgi:hypothetical protein